MRPILAIASTPRSGREPCAATPVVSTSSQMKPLCATQTRSAVGSVTIAASAGIPTVVFGPGGAGAHAVVEWVDLAQVRQCYEILLATAEEFSG
jgi:acetylornithine deacetylase/succinyl-diaminopimelate desuccinylase-like protein